MWLHVLALLSVARLARLVTTDRVTRPLRDWAAGVDRNELGNRTGPARRPLVDYFVECPWCTSIYLGAPVMIPVVVWPDSDIVAVVVLVLAGSLIAGLVAALEGITDQASDALDSYVEHRARFFE